MAISGKFTADFADFEQAVARADAHLKTFDTSAQKVGRSLGSMMDDFSGRKVIQEATLMEEAILRIGGSWKLTDAEQARVNRTVNDALAKYKALGQEAP